MRRGTQAAILFGDLLRELRQEENMTMAAVAKYFGVATAYVSQCEKAQRAVKEPKLDIWAEALRVDKDWLRKKWTAFQEGYPDPPIERRGRGKGIKTNALYVLIDNLTTTQRDRVLGYIQCLIESEDE